MAFAAGAGLLFGLLLQPQELAPMPSAGQAAPAGGLEGPLANGTTLPGERDALQRLVDGDQAWAAGAREQAFDLWREALARSAPAGALAEPPPGPAGDAEGTLARRAEDASHAVRRRLAALGAAEQAAWVARFEPLAAGALQRAGADRAQLADVERAHPLTRSAARAALALADLALERGDALAARTWCARGRAQGASDLEPAFARREAAAIPQGSTPGAAPDGALARASRLVLVREHELPAPAFERDRPAPGLACDARGAWVQSGGTLLALDAEGKDAVATDLRSLAPRGGRIPPAFAHADEPWSEDVALTENTLVALVGRALGAQGNALVALDLTPGPRAAPTLCWSWPDARGELPAELDGLVEFQPGLVLAGGRAVVQLRRWTAGAGLDEADVEAWCAAFDLRTGALVWARELARGATARGAARQRSGLAESSMQPALPLASDGQRALAGTELGVLALIDLADGRLAWSVRTARAGASADAGALGGAAASSADGATFWCAPRDAGGLLYGLRAGPDADGRGLWAAPPIPYDAALAPIHAEGARVLAFGTREGALALVELDAVRGGAAWSVPLGESGDHADSASALVEAERVLCATRRGLYLFDRAADLRLVERLEPRSAPGSVPGPTPARLARHGASVWWADTDLVRALRLE